MPATLDKISWDSNYVVSLIICDFRVPSKEQCYLLKFGKILYTRVHRHLGGGGGGGVQRGVLHVRKKGPLKYKFVHDCSLVQINSFSENSLKNASPLM